MYRPHRYWDVAIVSGLLVVSALLAACGGGSNAGTTATATTRGTLIQDPPLRVASLDAATLQAELTASDSGMQLLQLAGAPACGVDIYYLQYWTTGAANDSTATSGALMVPTGAAPACSGPRPMVLYAHGTQTERAFNIADITNADNSEGPLLAALFAAHGYIVVAPNYAGYDNSKLGYHPYLNASQQSGDMIDALAAARTALPKTFIAATTDSGKLFVTGYSQGGYVAMATQRALEAAGQPLTATAPMSGPYALEAFGDAVFYGHVNLGSTIFTPLLTTGYQHAYNNIYSATTDIYSATYATGIDTLLPATMAFSQLFATGKLPQTALFDSTTPEVTVPGSPGLSAQLTAALAVPSDPNDPNTPLFASGFGNPYLVNNDYRVSYVLDAATDPDGAIPVATNYSLAPNVPTQTLRRAFYLNDMRHGSWAPAHPMLMCGGDQDPTVFFGVNTGTMQAFWSGLPAGLVSVLDVNAAPAGPFASLQVAFQTAAAAKLAYYESPEGGSLSAAAARLQLIEEYHTSVAPFCALAARSFFSQF